MDAPCMAFKIMNTSTLKCLHFVFRWDAGKEIGNGHFMRCTVLSSALLNRGHAITVLHRKIPKHLLSLLSDLNISTKCIAINSDGLSELSDINQRKKIDWLVIDHYGIEAKWETEARKFASRIMVVDDQANRQHNCDLLLDQNVPNKFQTSYAALIPQHCVQALGWSYLLARPSFYKRDKSLRSGTLVFLGGGDHSEALSLLLAYLLKKTEFHPLRVLVSSEYLPLEHWQTIVGNCGNVDRDLIDPTSLYQSSALAVVRCGFVSYELALLGIPAINIHATSIQKEVALQLEYHGFGSAFKESDLTHSELLHTALQDVSIKNPNPLNEKLSPGALPVAKLLESIHEYK